MTAHDTSRTLAVAIALAFAVSGCSSAPALTDRDRIMVADVVNTTGDGMYAEAIKAAVQVSLQQSPFLTLLPDQRLQRTLRTMQRPADEPITGELARELCKRAGGKAAIEGSIAAAGSGFTIVLEAHDCQTGEAIAKEQAQAADQASVMAQVGAAVRGLRKRLGEPAATLEKYDADLTKAASATIEAMAMYGVGLRTRAVQGDEPAVAMFREAVRRDPALGIGHAKLAVVLSNTGNTAEARSETEKAYALRDQMTEYERLYIAWNYAARVTADQPAVKAALEQLTSTYPRDFAARNNFGVYYNNTGELEEALKQYRAASDIAPDEPGPLSNSAYVLLTLGRYDEASDAVDRALGMRPDANLAVTRWIAGRVAGLPRAGDYETAARQLAGPDQMALAEASLAAWSGRFQQFQKLQDDLVAKARQTGKTDLVESIAIGRAITLAAYRGGRDIDALKAAAAREKNPAFLVQQTSVLAMLGQIDAARAAVKRLDADKDAADLGPPLTVARAYVQAKDGKAAGAITALEAQLAAVPRARDLNYFIGDLHEQSGNADKALASYRVVIASLTYLGPNPLIPAARLKIARLLLKRGDEAGAKVQLDELLKQWKDADSEFPALTEAKALRARIKT